MARDPVKISKNLNDNTLANEIYVLPSDGTDTLDINADGSINIADGGNVISVDDGDASLTVDGTVTVMATQLDIDDLNKDDDEVLVWANTAKDGTGTDYVPLVDADGHLQVDILSGASGGTEYTEDDVAPATATGKAILAERDDALGGITPAEGDWTTLFTNARGALWVELDLTNDVTIADGGNSITVDDGGASLTVDGTVAATQSGTWDIGTLTSITNDVNIADGGNSITVDDGGTTLSIDDGGGTITVDGSVTVSATDLDIRDLTHATDSVKVGDGTDFLAVNSDGSINVVVQSSTGTAIADYSQAAALASATSDNHDYTASGGTFEPIRVEVSGESIGTFQILANAVVKGIVRTSVENPNATFTFPDGFSIADTQVLRVVRTNDSNKAHDFDSTIIGYQN